jgi:Protein of unknown function (DUF2752)
VSIASVDLARLRDLGLFLGGLGLALLLYLGDAGTISFPVCPFYAMTGLYCPGCGTLRCLHALLHGDLWSAVSFNAMTVLLAPVLLTAWLSVGIAAFRGRRSPKLRVAPRWIGLSLAGALGLFWLLRNVPVDAFSLLAP